MGAGGWTRTLCGGGITVHLVVSLHIKVHGTEYAHAITHSLTHTHTRVDVTQKSKMVDGSVGIVMETLSSSSAGPLTAKCRQHLFGLFLTTTGESTVNLKIKSLIENEGQGQVLGLTSRTLGDCGAGRPVTTPTPSQPLRASLPDRDP